MCISIMYSSAFCVADVRVPETGCGGWVRWMGERDVGEAADLPEDVRMRAKKLFAEISGLTRS